MSQFIHPLEEERYEALSPEPRWERVTDAQETEDGGLLCRRDSQETLIYLKAGEWRKVRAASQ